MKRRGAKEIGGRVIIGILILTWIAFGVAFSYQSAWAAEKAATNWVWSHGITLPGSEYEKSTFIDFPKRVSEATKGQLIIKPLHGVYDPGKNLFDARDGRCQGATVIVPYYGATIPSLCFANVPGLVFTYAEHKNSYLAIRDKYEKVVDAQGVKLLFYFMFSEILLNTKKPVKRVDDFKGLKMRIATLTTGQMLESMGASTMTVPVAEVYMAAQRGVIDGFDMSISPMLSLKLYEVAKYSTILPIGHPAVMVVVNKKAFESIPKDMQTALVNVGRGLEDELWGRIEAESKSKLEELAKRGSIFTKMPPEELNKVFELAKPVQQKWLQLQGPEVELRKEIIETVRKTIGK